MELTPEEVRIIEERRARLQEPTWRPRLSGSIPVEEKCAAFDRLYEMARSEFLEAVSEGWRDEDWGGYCHAAVLELLGEEVYAEISKWEKFHDA